MIRLKVLCLSTLFSWTSKGQIDETSYKIIDDIRAGFNYVKFISEEASEFTFENLNIKNEFIKDCEKYMPRKDLITILQKKVKPFLWDNNRLYNVKTITLDSLIKLNDATGSTNYILNATAPLIDDKSEFAIIRIFYQYPSYEVGGGVCYYLFRFSNDKWTEINRTHCIDY